MSQSKQLHYVECLWMPCVVIHVCRSAYIMREVWDWDLIGWLVDIVSMGFDCEEACAAWIQLKCVQAIHAGACRRSGKEGTTKGGGVREGSVAGKHFFPLWVEAAHFIKLKILLPFVAHGGGEETCRHAKLTASRPTGIDCSGLPECCVLR